MKRLFLAMFLVVSATPLFANDEGGDGAYIPDYKELVREGYGTRETAIEVYHPAMQTALKPTQAYYGNGFTVYYGYVAVPVRAMDSNMIYAFGHPVDYFDRINPGLDAEADLNRFAITVTNPYGSYGAGSAVASRTQHANATTVVQSATTNTAPANGVAPLPAIGEKPAH